MNYPSWKRISPYFKPFTSKSFKFGPFHFYRIARPNVMRHFMLQDDNVGVSIKKWNDKIKVICPIQYFLREVILDWFIDVFTIFDRDMDYKLEFNRRNLVYEFITDTYRKQIRDRIWPYNVVKIKSLDRHYHDRNDILKHAMMQIFIDYIELEADWHADPSNFPISMITDNEGKMVDENEYYHTLALDYQKIYKWAKTHEDDYQFEHSELDELREAWQISKSEYFKRMSDVDDRYDKLEEEMLALLLKHRGGGLWT